VQEAAAEQLGNARDSGRREHVFAGSEHGRDGIAANTTAAGKTRKWRGLPIAPARTSSTKSCQK